MSTPRHAEQKDRSWVDIVLLIAIGVVGLGFVAFIYFGVATVSPNVPSRDPLPSITAPKVPGKVSTSHSSQSPSKPAPTTKGSAGASKASKAPQGGSGGRNGGTPTRVTGGGSHGGGGQTPSRPQPVHTPTHRPLIGVTVPPINVPPIIGITLPPINLG